MKINKRNLWQNKPATNPAPVNKKKKIKKMKIKDKL